MRFSYSFHLMLLSSLSVLTVGCVSSSQAPEQIQPAVEPMPSTSRPKIIRRDQSSLIESDEQHALSLLRKARLNRNNKAPVESPQSSIALTTRGLKLAPPHGKASASTIIELLMTRAQSLIDQGDLDAARRDLSAAENWLVRVETDRARLLTQIELVNAESYLAGNDWKQAASHAARSRRLAKTLGLPGALFDCQAIVLLAKIRSEAPESKRENLTGAAYREVYEVLQENNYSEQLWDIAFTTLDQLGPVEATEIRTLMGPIPIWYFDSQNRSEAFIAQALTSKNNADAGKPERALLPTVSSPSMRPGFRECYQSELDEDHESFGSAVLLLEVDESGRVQNVSGRFLRLSQRLGHCLASVALDTKFTPSEERDVIRVPISLVKMD